MRRFGVDGQLGERPAPALRPFGQRLSLARFLQDAVGDELVGDRRDGGWRKAGVASHLDAGERAVLAQRLKQQKPVLAPDEIAVRLLPHGPSFGRPLRKCSKLLQCTNLF